MGNSSDQRQEKLDYFIGCYECISDGQNVILPESYQVTIRYMCGGKNTFLRLSFNEYGGFSLIPVENKQEESASLEETISMDVNGRVPLPEALQNSLVAEKSKSVMIVGLMYCFEIWSPAKWKEVLCQAVKDFPVCDNLEEVQAQ